jgi:hypothetical protein
MTKETLETGFTNPQFRERTLTRWIKLDKPHFLSKTFTYS